MDCNNVGSMISEVYDGEAVSPEAVGHIVKCGSCREKLRDYAGISAELRLLAAQDREETKMPMTMKGAMPRRNSLRFVLSKTMRVPRFAAAACALVIILLAGGWAHTRAQNTPLWFQYRFGFNVGGINGSAGAVTQACGQGCEHAITLSGSDRLAGLVDVQKIEDGKVYLSLRVKRFDTLPDYKHLADRMTDAPTTNYVYQPGKVIPIPVTGGGEVEMEGLIVASSEGIPGWPKFSSQPDENQIAVQQGVLIRDGQVIAEMSKAGTDGGKAAGPNAGFYLYVPGKGLFAAGLKPFDKAIAGSADYGQIRFTENGVKYLLLSASQITGGDQPRTVWVLRVPDYLPSHYDPQAKDKYMLFGTSGAIDKTLDGMGAMKRR